MAIDIVSEFVIRGLLRSDDIRDAIRFDVQNAADYAFQDSKIEHLVRDGYERAILESLNRDGSAVPPFHNALYMWTGARLLRGGESAYTTVLCRSRAYKPDPLISPGQRTVWMTRLEFTSLFCGSYPDSIIKGFVLYQTIDYVDSIATQLLDAGPYGYSDVSGELLAIETRDLGFHRYTNPPIDSVAALTMCDTIGPVCMANTLASCKNVRLVDQERDGPPRVILGSGPKRTIIPKITYKVLEIDPSKTPAARSGAHSGPSSQAFHLCRGHFANYDEKPLFGKYRGRFWVPAHTRGSKKNGAVLKDYKIISP